MLTLELPYPPSLNSYYRHVGGRVLISRSGRRYQSAIAAMLAAEPPRRMAGRLVVTLYVHVPDNRRRDLDNVQKCLLDSLQYAQVYMDDSQIDDLRIVRCNRVPNGHVRVTIIEAEHGTASIPV